MQLSLIFKEIPNPTPVITETLDPDQFDALLEVLVRLIAQTVQEQLTPEGSEDD